MKHTWIWCSINSLLIILGFLAIGINNYSRELTDQYVGELENRIEILEGELSVAQPDTIIVNVYNNINTK